MSNRLSILAFVFSLSLMTALIFYSAFSQSNFYGYVRNIEKTSGISGVNVTVYNSTFLTWNLTDANGYYEFPNLPDGKYNISFKKNGY